MLNWRVRLLGEEQICRAALGPIDMPDVWWPIFASLMTAPRRNLSRSALAGKVWPDREEQSARHCLASALWRIRQRLPADQRLISLEGENVALTISRYDWVDWITFESRALAAVSLPESLRSAPQRARLSRALSLYGGPLLPERDEEWIVVERERLRTLYLDALFALAHAETVAGDWPKARAAAQRLCAAEPLREDAQRLLMRAHVECGSRALAISQYRALVALLHSELGIGPMRETQQLAREISGGSAVTLEDPVECRPGDEALLQVREHLQQSLRLIDCALA